VTGTPTWSRSDAGSDTLPEALARAAATHALRYPYKVWGFGEDIALRALLELSDTTGDGAPAAFVHDLVSRWCRDRGALVPADHVAPGVVFLELHERHADAPYLETALELAGLLVGFPVEDGVSVHRRDLEPWRDTIWVDCTALDGPFLARLAVTTGDAAWARRGVEMLLGYARALQEERSGLFFHGYDVARHATSPIRWARGNGWALHGMVDTLEALPPDQPGAAEVVTRLRRLVAALAALQDEGGLWRTVLDDATSPLEASTAAFYASGVLKARRLGLLDDGPEVRALVERAIAAILRHARDDGGLGISSATPVGGRATYVEQSLGVYPWGQGPLLLTFTEGRRASTWRRARDSSGHDHGTEGST
jgi:unsaturated rhamnogalacturonyl hydrolase